VFDRFTTSARRAVVAAQDEALALGHDFIGTEHVLLGLATGDSAAAQVLTEHGAELSRVRDEAVRILEAAGITATRGQDVLDALSSIGIDVAEIQRRADDAFGPGKFTFPRPAFTGKAKRVLEQTLREAVALGHEHIGTEHMLLGLIAVNEGVAMEILDALGVDTAALRTAALSRLQRQAS
jgi:ATP-dependent Clp protease ATP-binding subunit ClpA